MNTNIIKKIILILVVATLLTIGLTGCGVGIIISTPGTVVVTVDRPGIYDIYMDEVLQGTTDVHGQRTITNVPGGTYYFVADGEPYGWYDFWGYWNYYSGYRTQTTYNGRTNYVTIPVYPYYD